MGRILFAAVAAGLLCGVVGCGSESDSARSTASRATAAEAPATTTTTAWRRPTSMLSPDGFGANPPTRDQLLEMGRWMDGPGKGARAATDQVSEGIDAMNAAAEATDVAALRRACQQVTDPLTIRLPASVPAPDPDVTNGLRFLIDDGESLSAACGALTDPPTDGQLTALQDAMQQLGTDLRSFGSIMMRNGDLSRSAAAGSR